LLFNLQILFFSVLRIPPLGKVEPNLQSFFVLLLSKVDLAQHHFSKKWYKTLAQPFSKVEKIA